MKWGSRVASPDPGGASLSTRCSLVHSLHVVKRSQRAGGEKTPWRSPPGSTLTPVTPSIPCRIRNKQLCRAGGDPHPIFWFLPSDTASFIFLLVSHPPPPEIRTVTYTPSGSSVDKGFSLVPYSNSRRTSRFVAPFVILLIVKKGLALPTDEFE